MCDRERALREDLTKQKLVHIESYTITISRGRFLARDWIAIHTRDPPYSSNHHHSSKVYRRARVVFTFSCQLMRSHYACKHSMVNFSRVSQIITWREDAPEILCKTSIFINYGYVCVILGCIYIHADRRAKREIIISFWEWAGEMNFYLCVICSWHTK